MNRTARAYANLTMMLIFFASAAESQKPNPGAAENAKILAYIDGSWNTLSRSMTSCKSLIDPKVTTPPILYLPAGVAVPPAVASVQHLDHTAIFAGWETRRRGDRACADGGSEATLAA